MRCACKALLLLSLLFHNYDSDSDVIDDYTAAAAAAADDDDDNDDDDDGDDDDDDDDHDDYDSVGGTSFVSVVDADARCMSLEWDEEALLAAQNVYVENEVKLVRGVLFAAAVLASCFCFGCQDHSSSSRRSKGLPIGF